MPNENLIPAEELKPHNSAIRQYASNNNTKPNNNENINDMNYARRTSSRKSTSKQRKLNLL